jgi:hypothetical protein
VSGFRSSFFLILILHVKLHFIFFNFHPLCLLDSYYLELVLQLWICYKLLGLFVQEIDQHTVFTKEAQKYWPVTGSYFKWLPYWMFLMIRNLFCRVCEWWPDSDSPRVAMSTTGGSTASGAPTPPLPQQTEAVTNSGYGSGDETTSLLAREPPVTITPSITPATSKPVLMRQECTTLLLSSPGHVGSSQESGTGVCLMEESTGGARSVPDIELHCRLQGDSSVGVTSPAGSHHGLTSTSTMAGTCRLRTASAGYHLLPHSHSRCRCGERRESHSALMLQPLARSVSRESVRSVGLHHHHQCPCNAAPCTGGSCPAPPPPVLLTTSPYR